MKREYAVRNVVIKPNLILAPMAGVTDSAFRKLIKRCGGVGLCLKPQHGNDAEQEKLPDVGLEHSEVMVNQKLLPTRVETIQQIPSPSVFPDSRYFRFFDVKAQGR